MSEKTQPRCVAAWLADPKDCWVRQGCRYWSRIEERCCYVERHEAELAAARKDSSGISRGAAVHVGKVATP